MRCSPNINWVFRGMSSNCVHIQSTWLSLAAMLFGSQEFNEKHQGTFQPGCDFPSKMMDSLQILPRKAACVFFVSSKILKTWSGMARLLLPDLVLLHGSTRFTNSSHILESVKTWGRSPLLSQWSSKCNLTENDELGGGGVHEQTSKHLETLKSSLMMRLYYLPNLHFSDYVAFFVQGVGNGFKYVLFFNFEPLSIRGNYQIRLLFKWAVTKTKAICCIQKILLLRYIGIIS